MITLLHRRFQGVDFNTYHLLKSLVYFADAEEEPMPRMIRPAEGRTIKEVLVAEARRLS